MMRIIFYLGANVLGLLFLSNMLDNFFIDDWTTALVVVLILTLLNWTVVPIIKFLAFPVNFLTLGFFNSLINLIVLWFVTENIKGVELTGAYGNQMFSLVIIAIVLSLASSISKKLTEEKDND